MDLRIVTKLYLNHLMATFKTILLRLRIILPPCTRITFMFLADTMERKTIAILEFLIQRLSNGKKLRDLEVLPRKEEMDTQLPLLVRSLIL
jgi:hypothetical protein